MLSGCSGPKVFAPPLSLRGDAAYTERVAPQAREALVTLPYATDRVARDRSDPKKRYSADRAIALTLGTAQVRFGARDDGWDRLASRTVAGDAVPLRITELDEFGTLPGTARRSQRDAAEAVAPQAADRFAQQINALIRDSGDATVTVFVHGYNTSFPWAVEKAASLWHVAGRRGVVVPYSWPAHDGPFAYSRDRESGAIAARALRMFLLFLAESTDAERINVLAYSAGAPVVVAALHQIRLIFADEEPDEIQAYTRLQEVVLVGADIDPDMLAIAALDRMQDVAERVTIYTSRLDRGLALSSLLFFDSPRLGRAERKLTPEQRLALRDQAVVDVVDVTRAQQKAGKGDLFGHGYWYGNTWVSTDLIRLLYEGDAPEDRGLTRVEDDGVWRFPDDYPDRVAGPTP